MSASPLTSLPSSEALEKARQRLIVALDVGSSSAARRIVAAIGASASTYKVGMQLYTAEGPQIVRELVSTGRKVFLDLKYHDIPNTAAAAVTEASQLGVSMLTVHALGGGNMLNAAATAGRLGSVNLTILGVTVLTSMDEDELNRVGINGLLIDEVVRLARLALDCGCHGVVASAHEAARLRAELGNDFLIVTPGVRLAGAAHGDQARVVTPAEAIAAGASHIVVGRPITQASNPAAAANTILEQLQVS